MNENKKLILFIDELERCAPAFASELLETITTYTGVECSIDNHTCTWNTDSSELFINNVSVVYIFDKEFLSKGLMNHFGQLPYDINVSNSFFNKYIKYEIVKESITWKQLHSKFHTLKIFKSNYNTTDDIDQKERITNNGGIDLREIEKLANKLKNTRLIRIINYDDLWNFITRDEQRFGFKLKLWLESVLIHKLSVNFLISFDIEIRTDIDIPEHEIAQNHINVIKSKNIDYEKFITALEYVADNYDYFEIEYCLDNSSKYNSKSTIESK